MYNSTIMLSIYLPKNNHLFIRNELTTQEDLQMRDILVKYWTNFAKYRNPSPVLGDALPEWYPYSDKKASLLLIHLCLK